MTDWDRWADAVAGSHSLVAEVRVITQWADGDDPEGDVVPIDGDGGGSVTFDETSDVYSDLTVTLSGVDPDDLESRWPRTPRDPLNPYGDELWLRLGTDLGADGVMWAPAGYYRINTTEQDSMTGGLQVSCQDRMSGIVDGRLVKPRSFPAHTTVATMLAELVGEVYPDAAIVFDDDQGLANIGRQVVVDRDRYGAIREAVRSLGKVAYWDGTGQMRVEDPPEETDMVWHVRAGRNGALVQPARRVSREGVHNGMVVIGESAGTDKPVRGIAVDVGQNSPTRWGGRFGKVPRFYSSQMVTTHHQAQRAARSMLRDSLGFPYSVDFEAAVHPAIRARHPVAVTTADGAHDRHLIQEVELPLVGGGQMSATTRDVTRTVIGSVVE